MAYALNFDEKLKQTLDEVAPEYDWKLAYRADARSKVDVAGLKGKIPRVFVEVELKKDNPVENIVKIWLWADREKNTHRILFLHAFSGLYHVEMPSAGSRSTKNKKPPKAKQYERAVFIGKRMKEDYRTQHIDYKQLLIRTSTRAGKRIQFKPRMRRGSVTKEGGAAMYRAAEILAKTIAKLLHSKSRG